MLCSTANCERAGSESMRDEHRVVRVASAPHTTITRLLSAAPVKPATMFIHRPWSTGACRNKVCRRHITCGGPQACNHGPHVLKPRWSRPEGLTNTCCNIAAAILAELEMS